MVGTVRFVRLVDSGARRGELMFARLYSDEGRGYFIGARDCGAASPRKGDVVTFTPDDDSDPRGPRARNVEIIRRRVDVDFEDLELTCCVCWQPFVLEAGERAFFHERELSQPRRCPTCRKAKRAAERGGRELVSQ